MAIRHACMNKWLRTTILACALIATGPTRSAIAEGGTPVDLLITGGTVYTGSDAPFVGDVAVTGELIVRVGPHLKVKAGQTINAAGMVVAPGFIDPHTHVDDMLTADGATERLVLPLLMQGVTTAFVGNDGFGSRKIALLFGMANPARVMDSSASHGKTPATGINFATYVGFGDVREAVLGGADRAPNAPELAAMQALVATGMCNGALGLSSGLFYAPQSFAKTGEVVALAREAAVRGGIYDSHIRDESSYTIGLLAAIDEAINIGREAGLPVHIAHIKALGVDVRGQAAAVIARVEAARSAGQDVTADQYPWSASGISLAAALIPRWAQDGGRSAMLARFDDPSMVARIRQEMAENLRRRGGAESLLLTSAPANVEGKTLAAVAAEQRLKPEDMAIVILRKLDASVASFSQSEADIAAFMRRPWVMTSSDASTGHPRFYGSFARKYAKYVKADNVISLRAFIESSSAVTAAAFSLDGRGHLKPGAFADIVVFDPLSYAARADYVQPTLFATGVRSVVVNGRVAVADGAPTGELSGRRLSRTPRPGSCPQYGGEGFRSPHPSAAAPSHRRTPPRVRS